MRHADKIALRRRAKTLPPIDEALSERLRARLAALPEWERARTVLLFAPLPGEPDLLPLASGAPTFFLPRCSPARALTVHRWRPADPLIPGPFGLREPDPTHSPPIDPEELDLAIVPSVLLSERGERLGHGAGYYDRFLPRLRRDCLRVGVHADSRLVATLPVDPWDIPLDIVLSETRIFRCGAGEGGAVVI